MPGGLSEGSRGWWFSSRTSSLESKQTQIESFPSSKLSSERFYQVPQQSQHHEIMIILLTFGQKRYCPTSNQTWLQPSLAISSETKCPARGEVCPQKGDPKNMLCSVRQVRGAAPRTPWPVVCNPCESGPEWSSLLAALRSRHLRLIPT